MDQQIKNFQAMPNLLEHATKSDPTDIAVTAAGGLVGEVIQVWKPKNILMKQNGV